MPRLSICLILSGLLLSAEPLRVRVVTGGPDHALSFYSVFEARKDWRVAVDGRPTAFPAHRHEGYRRLVRNAVLWAGRREA
jgi:hypothetical protein